MGLGTITDKLPSTMNQETIFQAFQINGFVRDSGNPFPAKAPAEAATTVASRVAISILTPRPRAE